MRFSYINQIKRCSKKKWYHILWDTRYNNIHKAQRYCYSSKTYVEDEFHFIIMCPAAVHNVHKIHLKYI